MNKEEKTESSKDKEWFSKAPIGYLNAKKSSNKKIIVDKSTAPLIRRLFEEYSTDNYSLSEIKKEFEQWSLNTSNGIKKLSLSYINRIIQDPFYYGVIRISRTNKEFNHSYAPIISKELFKQCQKVRLKRLNVNINNTN